MVLVSLVAVFVGAAPVTGDDEIALALGDEVTCTVQNRWEGAQLTLAKQVDGGPGAPVEWTLTADGPTAVAGASGAAEATAAGVTPGDYTLVPVPSGGATGSTACRTRPCPTCGHRRGVRGLYPDASARRRS
ncbi:hypothetical protein [Cellulomonas sp. GbtcB1]|uniref:hypothetical protein n=1 Tax=Cellulomonas sp. GbtcB1 TaxID=2824746 RepID=UPI001C305B10|nr:hypothetical protein [Cellulomonas sp. GbtcB1]